MQLIKVLASTATAFTLVLVPLAQASKAHHDRPEASASYNCKSIVFERPGIIDNGECIPHSLAIRTDLGAAYLKAMQQGILAAANRSYAEASEFFSQAARIEAAVAGEVDESSEAIRGCVAAQIAYEETLQDEYPSLAPDQIWVLISGQGSLLTETSNI